jgi:hypothetical protein
MSALESGHATTAAKNVALTILIDTTHQTKPEKLELVCANRIQTQNGCVKGQ